MKTIWLAGLACSALLTVWSCQSGVTGFLDDGDPDLIPVPAAGFCRNGSVVVTLRNQGPGNAEASTTTVTFAGGGSVRLPTPEVDGGRIATLSPVAIPGACYVPNCFFQVIVDSDNDVDESNESNNTVDGTCSPPS